MSEQAHSDDRAAADAFAKQLNDAPEDVLVLAEEQLLRRFDFQERTFSDLTTRAHWFLLLAAALVGGVTWISDRMAELPVRPGLVLIFSALLLVPPAHGGLEAFLALRVGNMELPSPARIFTRAAGDPLALRRLGTIALLGCIVMNEAIVRTKGDHLDSAWASIAGGAAILAAAMLAVLGSKT